MNLSPSDHIVCTEKFIFQMKNEPIDKKFSLKRSRTGLEFSPREFSPWEILLSLLGFIFATRLKWMTYLNMLCVKKVILNES